MMERISSVVTDMKSKEASEIIKAKIREMERVIRSQQQNDVEWENFRIYFEKVHTNFFDKLKADFDGLTISDLRLAALTKLNLSIKETAQFWELRQEVLKQAGIDFEQNLV